MIPFNTIPMGLVNNQILHSSQVSQAHGKGCFVVGCFFLLLYPCCCYFLCFPVSTRCSSFSLISCTARIHFTKYGFSVSLSLPNSFLECSTIFMMMLTQFVQVCVCVCGQIDHANFFFFFFLMSMFLLFIHSLWSILLTSSSSSSSFFRIKKRQ